jgi:hypothetical protein
MKERSVGANRHMRQCDTYVVTREVVNRGLGKHSVVLELTLAERRSVGSDDDQLGLAGLWKNR